MELPYFCLSHQHLQKILKLIFHYFKAAVFNQQNTSDDYVLVSPSNEYVDPNTGHVQSPNQQLHHQQQQQQQQLHNQQQKTFFTTLNPATDLPSGQHRNINEFINRCENSDEGINFLQDSEIQSRQQLHHQQQQQQHHQPQQMIDNFQGQIPNNAYATNYQGINKKSLSWCSFIYSP